MKKLYNLKKGLSFFFLLFCCVAMVQEGAAQINPLKAMYFQNQYLANPAMAGVNGGLRVNLHYRNQWGSISDAPTTEAITADYGLSNKVGLGLNLGQNREGLLKRSRAMATYSYHLPLNQSTRQLHFGLSAGVVNEQIDMDEMVGDVDDNTVAKFNDQGPYFEGEVGVAYTDSKLTIQGSFPNIRAFLDKSLNERNTVNRSTYFAAASYKLAFGSSVGVEPKVVYRGVKGYDDLIDAGANLTFVDNQFNVFGMYHSSENVTFGFGVDVKKRLAVTGMYTTGSPALNSLTGVKGSFELGLRASLWNVQ
ncbi:PorP/SprF family type IX secretion system membrane protein [Rufibacter latericius]|uniref:Type IX secretion system membrane protein PorP/SprF n=1 Tax=Rufibacter latericius TaxID=2487040 RepID=A0A3M9N207_9BACT|nr:PorP/SprF family type IX secretion system membrane protein [Rufibacter latericius]RNI31435.1 type IX secretion system membrane protein PorP/SprF [Rufibacter latericius]